MPRKKRKPGLKDIANKVGMSVATVSMALSDDPSVRLATRQRVRRVSEQLGYVRPRGIGRPRRAHKRPTGAAFVVLAGSLEDESHAMMRDAVAAAADMQHMRLEYLATADPNIDAEVTSQLITKGSRLGGLILYGQVNLDLLLRLARARIPHLVIGRPMTDLVDVPTAFTQSIHSDEHAMAELAVRTLLPHGKRIAFICERLLEGLWNERWLKGYRAGLELAGIDYDDQLVQITQQTLVGGEPAARILSKLKHKPDSYIIPDARVTATFRDAMQKANIKIPGNRIVTSGHLPLIEKYHLKDCHRIGFDLQRLADLAVYHMRSLIERPMPCPTELLVPISTSALGLKV